MSLKLLIPKKSTHIEVYPFNNNEYIIKQTFYGHQININRKTFDVLELVDGKRSIQDILLLLNNTNGISEEIIYSLLYEKLGKYGIIEVENINVEKRVKPDYLKLSFTLLKKEWIKPIAKILSPLFLKSIFYPILLISLIIVFGVLFFNFKSLIIALDNLSLYQWLTYIILSGIILFFHEFGHASSCYKHGAEYGEIGFGFYLFIPTMFADVSDIWRLKPNKRIIVNLSGIYIELILGSIFSILFLLSNNSLFLILSSIISLTVITNLNPFLRYDGYWILSDLIGVPNLRKESNKKLSSIFKKEFERKNLYTKDIFLALYGLISNFIIVFILFSIILNDPYGLLFFPKNLFNYIENLLNGTLYFTLSDIYKFILPFIFYYILIKFLFSLIMKYFKLVNRKND